MCEEVEFGVESDELLDCTIRGKKQSAKNIGLKFTGFTVHINVKCLIERV
jgi:hypothetical protein